jgi:hypothetical protein
MLTYAATGENYGAMEQKRVRKKENELWANFYKPSDYSSWFKARMPLAEDGDKVGQFNFFFRITLPSAHSSTDKLIDGTPMASVVLRNPSSVSIPISSPNVSWRSTQQLKLIQIDTSSKREASVYESYFHDYKFLPLTLVYSSAMLVLPIDNTPHRMPLHATKVLRGAKNESKISSLFLIPMHPQRLSCVNFEFEKMKTLYHNISLDRDRFIQASETDE